LAKGDGWIADMRRTWLLAGLIALLLALLIYAWIDGGRAPLREIVVPVPLPEEAR
jgi:hypothetical protein